MVANNIIYSVAYATYYRPPNEPRIPGGGYNSLPIGRTIVGLIPDEGVPFIDLNSIVPDSCARAYGTLYLTFAKYTDRYA